MAILELNGICKGFGLAGDRAEILRDIDLEIEQGEFVAIVGLSGTGKTTLISIIAGLLAADRGTIRSNGRDVLGPGPDRGVVFQNYSLLPWMTVYENVLLAVDAVCPEWSRKEKKERVDRYIAMVNLTPAHDKKPDQLSGGMKQRVSVARALAMDPEILLLDEPFSALDALTRATLQDEIERIWEQDRKTVVMITNDVDEGILLADRIIPLIPGRNIISDKGTAMDRSGATLGPAITVGIDKPRDRKALNHDPDFRRVRNMVIECLLGRGMKLAPARPRTTGRQLGRVGA